jgi:hypothetical protein
MKRQFVISINDDSPATVNKMVELFDALESVKWSHYIKGLWQVVDISGKFGAEHLRDRVRKTFPSAFLMVFEMPSTGDWSGYVPHKMRDWIDENWE